MSRKWIRLPAERELKVIKDNGLHEALVSKHAPEVRRALEALVHAIPQETIPLELAVSTLAGLLGAQSGIRRLISEVAALGSSPLDEREMLDALARWIIDNQIGRGFPWDPGVMPSRSTRRGR